MLYGICCMYAPRGMREFVLVRVRCAVASARENQTADAERARRGRVPHSVRTRPSTGSVRFCRILQCGGASAHRVFIHTHTHRGFFVYVTSIKTDTQGLRARMPSEH